MAAARLEAAGIPQARLDARLLVGAATGESPDGLLASRDRPVEGAARARLDALLARRLGREPVARILGEREFWSLPFRLGPATIVPRPETETLVEAALDAVADRVSAWRVLDLGTGSGCLLLALLSELPAAWGVGTDIALDALTVAAANARRLGLDGRGRWLAGPWTDPLDGAFDLIVANPPYVPAADIEALEPEVAAYDPRAALDGGADGLDAYRALLPGATARLATGGRLLLEVGAGQATPVAALARGAGLAVSEIRPDLAGVDRCVVCRHRP